MDGQEVSVPGDSEDPFRFQKLHSLIRLLMCPLGKPEGHKMAAVSTGHWPLHILGSIRKSAGGLKSHTGPLGPDFKSEKGDCGLYLLTRAGGEGQRSC